MIYFHNDYSEGCHEKVLERLVRTNLEQTPGYGMDEYCTEAAGYIRAACGRESVAVHFLVGGTQTNLTVIDAALRPHQAAIGAESAHINVHETGAVEATGHKVLTLPSSDGKITAAQVRAAVQAHYASANFEHTAQPKLVYISNPTEYGTLYSLAELEALSAVCREKELYLFCDGARLGYGLAAPGYDVQLSDLARLCDVFYIGGTKVGALFGEAVVIGNMQLAADFRYLIKQHGAMLAKGRLLGVQFAALFEDGLYMQISAHAVRMADEIRAALDAIGAEYYLPGATNQIFVILSDEQLNALSKDFTFEDFGAAADGRRVTRICTSWATTRENVAALCAALRALG